MFTQMLAQTYNAQVNSGLVRIVVQPVGAPTAAVSDNAAAAWAWSAYVQIVVAATITDPSWLCGVIIHTAVVEIHNGDLAIASGAAAAEVDLAIFGYAGALVGATAPMTSMPILSQTLWLPYPIRVTGAPRLAVRVRKSTAASLAGVSLKVVLAEAVGT